MKILFIIIGTILSWNQLNSSSIAMSLPSTADSYNIVLAKSIDKCGEKYKYCNSMCEMSLNMCVANFHEEPQCRSQYAQCEEKCRDTEEKCRRSQGK